MSTLRATCSLRETKIRKIDKIWRICYVAKRVLKKLRVSLTPCRHYQVFKMFVNRA